MCFKPKQPAAQKLTTPAYVAPDTEEESTAPMKVSSAAADERSSSPRRRASVGLGL